MGKIGWLWTRLYDSRKLVFYDEAKGNTYFLVKPSDVATMWNTARRISVLSADILLEITAMSSSFMIRYRQMQDLRRRRKGFSLHEKSSQSRHHLPQYKQILASATIDLITLHGSIEIAPLVNLSDVIVDIVETGTTLRENNLVVHKEICPVSTRYIANKVSYTYKNEEIRRIYDLLKNLEAENND